MGSRNKRKNAPSKLEEKPKNIIELLSNSQTAALIGFIGGIFTLVAAIIQAIQVISPYIAENANKPFIPSSASTIKLLVPLYIFPDGNGVNEWNAVIQASKRVPITVIVNPDSGPGICPQPIYSEAINRLLDNNIETLGYVTTQQANRDQNEVKSDIDTYLDCYKLDGVFIEAKYAATTENLSYYYSLYWYAKHKNGQIDRMPSPLVFLDTGNMPDNEFYEQYYIEPAFDTAIIFEGANSPSWGTYSVNNYIKNQHSSAPFSATIIHSTSTIASMQKTINKAIERNIDYIYVTDMIMDNPWNALPTYWDAEVAYIEVVNSNTGNENSVQP